MKKLIVGAIAWLMLGGFAPQAESHGPHGYYHGPRSNFGLFFYGAPAPAPYYYYPPPPPPVYYYPPPPPRPVPGIWIGL
jgi:hypothetical protein